MKHMERILFSLRAPLIVFPGGWEDTIPEWVKEHLPMSRLAADLMGMKKVESDQRNVFGGREVKEVNFREECTDLEALAYIYTAVMCAPRSSEWVNIYCYLVTKEMERWKPFGNTTVPADVRRDELTEEEERELRRLKAWIYDRQVQRFKEVLRSDGNATQSGPEPETTKGSQRTLASVYSEM